MIQENFWVQASSNEWIEWERPVPKSQTHAWMIVLNINLWMLGIYSVFMLGYSAMHYYLR